MSTLVLRPDLQVVYRDGTPTYEFQDFVGAAIAAIEAAESAYAPPPVRDEATDPYTLVLNDANEVIRCTAANAAVTVPQEASVDFPVGTEVRLRQAGTGTLVLTTTGLTINGTLPTWSQHVEVTLRKVGSDEWDVI